MVAASNVFPAFIRAEYDPGGNGFSAFQREGLDTADRVKRQFEASFADIQKLTQRALSMPRNAGGSLDLGVGEYKNAAQAAQVQATALREVAAAAERAATRNRDNSEETRLYVQAARAAAIEAEGNARALTQQSVAVERLQAELSRTRSATVAVLTGNRAASDETVQGVNRQRAAYQQLNFQLQDVTQQLALGVNPFIILAQQGGQVADALSNLLDSTRAVSGGMQAESRSATALATSLTNTNRATTNLEGKTAQLAAADVAATATMSRLTGAAGQNATAMATAAAATNGAAAAQGRLAATGAAAARFMAGPYGSAVIAAASILGMFALRARESEEALKAVELASSGLAEAQSVLGEMFDLTSGKLKKQNELLKLNAELTAYNLKIEADAARARVESAAEGAGISTFERIAAVLGRRGRGLPAAEQAAGRVQAILQGVLEGKVTSTQAQASMSLGDLGTLGMTEREFRTIVKDAVEARFKEGTSEAIKRTLASGVLDPSLRRDPPKGRDRTKQLANLQEAGRDALDKVDAIAGRFADQPRAVAQAQKAMADLTNIARDLGASNKEAIKISGKGIADYGKVLADIEKARGTVREGLIRGIAQPFERAIGPLEKAREALGDLDQVSKLPGFENMAANIGKAGDALRESLRKPLDDVLLRFDREAEIQDKLIAGREVEADLLREKFSLMDALGAKTEEELDEALRLQGTTRDINDILRERVEISRENARQIEIERRKLEPYLSAVDDIRSNIQQTIEGVGSRGLFRSAGDFIKNLQGTYTRLVSEVITEKLFGSVFDDLERMIRGEDPVKKAAQETALAFNGTATAADRLATTFETVAGRIGAATPTAALPAAAAGLPSLVQDIAGAAKMFTAPTGQLPLLGAITGSFAQHLARGSKGLDIDGKLGDLIRAPAAGKVLTVGYDRRSGHHVVLDHGGGIVSSYSHLLKRPRLGAVVGAGDIVGQVGNSGNVRSSGGDGSHLHDRVRVNGQDVDPATYRFPAGLQNVPDRMADVVRAVEAASDLLDKGAEAFAGAGETAQKAANDEIVVVGQRKKNADLSPGGFVESLVSLIARKTGSTPEQADRLGKKIGTVVSNALQGAAYGQAAAATVLGRKGSPLGASIGGAIGNIAGKAIGKTIGGTLGKYAGPLGSIAGGILGGAVGGLLRSSKRGSTAITVGADGRLQLGSARGNSGAMKKASNESASGAITTIERIAESLGATILPGRGSVSIGVRDGKYRVDPTGRGRTKGSGVLKFGEDANAAVRAATLDLIRDGILGGLRASTQRLLQGAKDLDLGLEKAMKFESVFTELKRRLDPVGAELDVVNRRFEQLKRIFQEAGATAEEVADLEKLYGLEREEAIKQAGEAMTSALKGLLDDLTVNNDARSLRERLSMARAKYDPLAADLAAGKKVDYDVFAEAARNVEQLMRQLEGSQTPYFDFLNQLTDLTGKALADQEKVISIATGKPGPFGGSAAGANDNAPVVSAIDKLEQAVVGAINGQLNATNRNLGLVLEMFERLGGGNRFPAFQNRTQNF